MFTSLKKKIFSKKDIKKSTSVLHEIYSPDEEEISEDSSFSSEDETPFDKVNKLVVPTQVLGDFIVRKQKKKGSLIGAMPSPSSSSNSLTVSGTPRTPKSARAPSKYVLIGTLWSERSTVQLAEYYDEEIKRVIKVILKKQDLLSPRTRQFLSHSRVENMIQKELSDEAYMSHRGYPFVVKYIDDFKCPEFNEHFIVMEYCDCGSLLDVSNDLTKPYPLPILRRFFLDILLGLEYMHHHGIPHRDIKPDNLFLHFNGSRVMCKIGDFGLSVVLQPNVIDVGAVGSSWYIAPEVIQSTRVDDPKTVIRDPFLVDVWAFGVVTYCMSELQFPFNPDDPSTPYEAKERAVYNEMGRMTREETVTLYNNIIMNVRRERDNYLDDENFGHFIDAALEHHVPSRPSVTRLIMHPFMRGEMKTMSKLEYLRLNRKGEWSQEAVVSRLHSPRS